MVSFLLWMNLIVEQWKNIANSSILSESNFIGTKIYFKSTTKSQAFFSQKISTKIRNNYRFVNNCLHRLWIFSAFIIWLYNEKNEWKEAGQGVKRKGIDSRDLLNVTSVVSHCGISRNRPNQPIYFVPYIYSLLPLKFRPSLSRTIAII